MNKLLIFFAFLFITGGSFAQDINWMSMNEALEAQKEEPRKIFMDAYTTWCGPCKMLDKNTFKNEALVAYVNENFYPVKFNAEGNEEISYKDMDFNNPNFDPEREGRNSPHQFATAMGISGYPSLAFFDEQGELFEILMGYRDASQLEIFLKVFAQDDFLKIKTEEDWVEYEENFEYTF